MANIRQNAKRQGLKTLKPKNKPRKLAHHGDDHVQLRLLMNC